MRHRKTKVSFLFFIIDLSCVASGLTAKARVSTRNLLTHRQSRLQRSRGLTRRLEIRRLFWSFAEPVVQTRADPYSSRPCAFDTCRAEIPDRPCSEATFIATAQIVRNRYYRPGPWVYSILSPNWLHVLVFHIRRTIHSRQPRRRKQRASLTILKNIDLSRIFLVRTLRHTALTVDP